MFKDTATYEYCERLIALKGQEKKVFKLVLDNRTIRDLIVFLNTDQQLGKEHVDAFGQRLFNRITRRTVYADNEENNRKGRVGKFYELLDTGEYWDSFKVTIFNGKIKIVSNPLKGDDNLEQMYGAIEGLTDENLQVLINQAYEFFIKWYRDYLLR